MTATIKLVVVVLKDTKKNGAHCYKRIILFIVIASIHAIYRDMDFCQYCPALVWSATDYSYICVSL